MKATVKRFIHIWNWDKDKEDPNYEFFKAPDESLTSLICTCSLYLGEVELSFEVPPMPSNEEQIKHKLNVLRKGREETVQEFTTKLANIDEQIKNLLALPNLENDSDTPVR